MKNHFPPCIGYKGFTKPIWIQGERKRLHLLMEDCQGHIVLEHGDGTTSENTIYSYRDGSIKRGGER